MWINKNTCNKFEQSILSNGDMELNVLIDSMWLLCMNLENRIQIKKYLVKGGVMERFGGVCQGFKRIVRLEVLLLKARTPRQSYEYVWCIKVQIFDEHTHIGDASLGGTNIVAS